MSKEPPYRVIKGIFYTDRDGPLEGVASSNGSKWSITTKLGKTLNRQDIFLDRGKYIYAPKNPDYLDWGRKQALELVEKYEREVSKL